MSKIDDIIKNRYSDTDIPIAPGASTNKSTASSSKSSSTSSTASSSSKSTTKQSTSAIDSIVATRYDNFPTTTDDILRTTAEEMTRPTIEDSYAYAPNNTTRRAAHYEETADRLRERAEALKTDKDEAAKRDELYRYLVDSSEPRAWSYRNPKDSAAAINLFEQVDDYQKTVRNLNKRASSYDSLASDTYDAYYRSLSKNPDFAEKSKATATANGGNITPGLYYTGDGMFLDTTGADSRYAFINNENGMREKVRQYQIALDPDAQAGAEPRMGTAEPYGVFSPYIFMENDEIKTYNYLYATEGKDSADKYLDRLLPTLNGRWRTASEGRMTLFAYQDPVGASLYSSAMSPLKAASYAGQWLDMQTDGKLERNARYNRFSYNNTAIRDKVSSDIEKKWGKWGARGYNIGMSVLDSLVNMLPVMMTGGAAAAAEGVAGAAAIENIMLAVMGAGAAADTVIAKLDEGADDATAMTLGTIAGLVEFATERIGVDNLMNLITKNIPQGKLAEAIAVALLSNAAAEGGEEGISDIANWTADAIYAGVTGNETEFMRLVEAYMREGNDLDRAFTMATVDRLQELGLDTAGGAVSGLFFGFGGTAINLAGSTLSERAPAAPKTTQSTDNTALFEAAQRIKELDYKKAEENALLRAAAEMYLYPRTEETPTSEIAPPSFSDYLDQREVQDYWQEKLRNAYLSQQQAPSIEAEPVSRGTVNAEEIAGQQVQNSKNDVAKYAESLGKAGEKAFNEMYIDGQNAEDYIKAMTRLYNYGKKDLVTAGELEQVIRDYEGSTNVNANQLEAAYLAGQADGNVRTTAPETVAEKNPALYNEEKTSLADALDSYNRYIDNGIEYTITQFARNGETTFVAEVRRAGENGAYPVTNARDTLFTGFFPTREDAAQALVNVAENNGLIASEPMPVENTDPNATGTTPEPLVSGPGNENIADNGGIVDEHTGIKGNLGEEQAVEEVPHGGRNEETPADSTGDSGLLDEVATENVQQPEGEGAESDKILRGKGRRGGRPSDRSDVGGAGGRPGLGDSEGTVPADSDVTTPTVKEETAEQIEVKDELAVQEEPRGSNFVIPAKGLSLPAGEKARFKANINAIKTLRTIMAEGRLAMPSEQEILSKYVGWGGLANAFDERKADWAKEFKQLKGLLTEEEYKAARGSTLNAHYTDVGVIRGIYAGLEKIGFKGGRLLEPSAGIGHFVGAMPENLLPGVKSWTMVELDNITGNIARYLYPNADVRVQGFELANIPDNYMDMAISNVPFGNYAIVDKAYPKEVTGAIHNYFFAKALDKVRPGGLVTFITSRYTMDARDSAVRRYIMRRADLLGAIRLPETAFRGNAGTDVVTDILVLKKREPGKKYNGEDFENTNYYHTDLQIWDQTNDYFHNHPEMVLGEASNAGSMYRSNSLTYIAKDTKLSLQKQIEKAFGKIKGTMDYPVRQTSEEIRREIKKAEGRGKEGSVVKRDGKFYTISEGELVEANIAKKDEARMDAVIGMRDFGRTLLDAQMNGGSDAQISSLRKELNKSYDDFVKKNGPLHKPANKKLIRSDSDYPFILALENYDKKTGKATKAAIFSKNTVAKAETVTHANTVEEGLTVVLNETGEVDFKRIAELSGESEKAVAERLLNSELVFLDRDGNPVTAEVYLSGNVKAKLRDAEALAEGNPEYKRNVEALKKVIPADIAPEEISVRPGVTWVPDNIYSDFAAEMLGSSNRGYSKAVTVQYTAQTGQFTVTLNQSWLKFRPENTSTWGTPDKPFNKILEATLNNRNVTVWRKTEDGGRILDKQATAAAQEKQEKILAEFQKWIWQDEERKTTLATLYNDIFNNTVTPKYDGSNLTVLGYNAEKPLKSHQKDAVQRIINSGGNTLLAHRVGAGKTYEMAAAAMKLRQIGVVKKPMFIVPKSLVSQWGNEFLDFFPAAKVLVAGDNSFTPANRKQFINQIATGDYDAVIVSYEQFKKVPMSIEHQNEFYQKQIDELEEAIRETAQRNGKRDPSIKQLEKSKKSLEAKLRKKGDMKKDEDNTDFEALGVDSLFVDEAHNYKNLFYTTNMQNVAGLGGKNGSERAFDLYMKVRYLQQLNGGRGVVFATATPVMNSMSEMYIMQKYLQSDLLDAKGLTSFDAWANQFGEVRTVLEMNPSGKGFRQKQSFSRFKNLAELQQMFRSFADVITEIPDLKIPAMKTGKRIIVESDPGDFQLEYIDKLAERADAIKGRRVDPREDNMLKITSEGRKLSYTQRMIDSALPYEDDNKITKCAQNVYDIWKESAGNKGTQLIFCDLSTPKGGAQTEASEDGADTTTPDVEDISIYDDIKNMLVAQGVPANEIAFIHDADTQEKRLALFDEVNAGNVRVLIGSTGKMGVGMNAQKRIVALHHLDAPWRPGDIEQREGRALRQGNINDEVGIYVYITKKTFDSRMWDNLQRKASFIHQVMAGELSAREAEGDGDFALSAAEIKAIASGNPLIIEQFEVAAELTKLEALERAHNKEVADARARLNKTNAQIVSDEETAQKLKVDLAARKDTTGDKFTITINGETLKERKAAGEALIAQAKKYLDLKADTEQNHKIGTFAGFDLLVTSKGDVLLKGAAQYRGSVNMQSAAGTIQALEAMPKRIDIQLENVTKRLEEGRASIKKLEKIIASPFDRADELATARQRNAEIMAELNPSEDTGEGFDEVEQEDQFVDVEPTQTPVEQGISSAGTSIKQVPALFKDKNVSFGKVNVDIGGGKYDLATEYLKERGTLNLVFDPYNRGEAQNTDTLNYLRGGYKADTATCANVLNVIAEPDARANVVLEAAKCIKPDGKAYFMVYEGDGSGVGRQTSAGWQNNRKTATYMEEIRQYFRSVKRMGKLIVAEEPKSKLPKASWEVTPGKAISYSRDSGGIAAHPEEWTAKRVGSEDKAPMILAEIIEKIRHDFGINVGTGNVRGSGVRGQYNQNEQGIRTRIAQDLPVAAHELGHHFDNIYSIVDNMPDQAKAEYNELLNNMPAEFKANYKEEKQPYEGVAEFLRKFLQNRETTAIDYPNFTQYFLNTLSGPDQAKIEQLADEVNAYYSLDAETAASAIRGREEKTPDFRTWREKVKDTFDAVYQAMMDSNHSIKRFEEAVGGSGKVYKLATNSAYAGNRAAAAIDGDLYDVHGAYVGPGLRSCFAGNEKFLKDKTLYKALGEYLVVKHGPERLAEGMRIFADDRKNSTAFMNRRQMELEAQYPELVKISDKLYEFQRQFLKTWGVETGLVSENSFDEWGDRWQYYVPFNRAVDEKRRGIGAKRGFANQDSTIRKAVGSGLDIIHPVDNIINNMVKMINAGVRNNVMLEITRMAKRTGDANFLEKVYMPVKKTTVSTESIKQQLSKGIDEGLLQGLFDDTSAAMFETIVDSLDDVLEQYGRGVAHGDTVTVLNEGKPEYWKINDAGLLSSVTNMAPAKLSAILEAYGTVSRFMTGNITGNNILWSLFSNAPRDLMTLFTYIPGTKNPAKVFSAMGSAYANKIRGDHADPLYKEYLAMGGGSTNAYTADRDMVKRAREKLAGKNISANPLDWIAFTSDLIEMGPRFATYKLLRNNGMSPEMAFYEAMDVTVNFKRGGHISRQINKVVPFFNASEQGLDKFARWLTAQDIPKEDRAKVVRGRTIGWIAVSAALGALFYLLNNYDDERKKEYQQLSNYTKNSYWVIPLGDGQYFAIPKPRELAVLSSFFETAAERLHGKNEYAFDEFYQYFANTTLPNVVADLAQGDIAGAVGSTGLFGIISYMMANRDFLGKPIESAGMQYLEPKDRYNDRTSRIAWAIGQAFNMSPQMVDYFFQQTLGGWWKTQKALFPVGGENVDYTLGVQGSYVKDNQYSTDIINRLYDYAEQSSQRSKSHPEDFDLAITAKMDDNMTTFYSRYNSRAKQDSRSVSARGARQTVLNMILEYEKARDDGSLTKAQKAVYEVCRKNGDVGEYLPSVMQNSVKDGNSKTHLLSAQQYVRYQTEYDRFYWEIVEDSLPVAKTNEEKAATIKAAKATAKERATTRLLHRLDAPTTPFETKYDGVSDADITTFKALLDIANNDGSLKQDEVIEAIRRMQQNGLKNDDASTLFRSKYDSDKNNPWA